MTITCAHCGKEFISLNKRKYCPDCAAIVQHERVQKAGEARLAAKYPDGKHCLDCGAEIPNKRHYCDNCKEKRKERHRAYDREYKRKYRAMGRDKRK